MQGNRSGRSLAVLVKDSFPFEFILPRKEYGLCKSTSLATFTCME